MRSLKEAMREDKVTKTQNSKAFDVRFAKDDGADVFLPAHLVDFVERDARDATKFDHETYLRMGNRVRNTKAKRTYDIHHKVTHRDVKKKQSTVDKR